MKNQIRNLLIACNKIIIFFLYCDQCSEIHSILKWKHLFKIIPFQMVSSEYFYNRKVSLQLRY